MHETVSEAGTKTIVTAAVPLATLMSFDEVWLMIVPLGLVIGWMARASRSVTDRKPWDDIRRDLIASILIGGAHGTMAAFIIWCGDLNYLQGLGVTAVVAFMGIGSLDMMVRWLMRKIIDDQQGKRS
jgi:hypothetical protein